MYVSAKKKKNGQKIITKVCESRDKLMGSKEKLEAIADVNYASYCQSYCLVTSSLIFTVKNENQKQMIKKKA